MVKESAIALAALGAIIGAGYGVYLLLGDDGRQIALVIFGALIGTLLGIALVGLAILKGSELLAEKRDGRLLRGIDAGNALGAKELRELLGMIRTDAGLHALVTYIRREQFTARDAAVSVLFALATVVDNAGTDVPKAYRLKRLSGRVKAEIGVVPRSPSISERTLDDIARLAEERRLKV